MNTQCLFLGIDVSTTGAKALLVNEKGEVLSSATTPLSLSTPHPLWSEQAPEDWWRGVVLSIRGALSQAGVNGSAVAAVGLTGQMHGLVILNEAGEVLRPAILWNDQRTGEECDEIRRRVGFAHLIQVTGNNALTGFTAPKILWVQRHEPEIYAQIRHILLPKDYVRYCLTGEYAMDKADGSGTILFDLRLRDWSDEIVSALGIAKDWLPPTYEGPVATGHINQQAAEQTGLEVGTPVMAGGGDQAAGAVGVGAVEAGIVSLALGTSGVVFATTDAPRVEPEGRLHAFCHAVPGTWHFMGVMLSAAGSLQWYRDTFAQGESFDQLLKPAEEVPAGCEGLLFLPYLTGERTPHPDPLARAAWVGLTVRHTQAHISRSVLEGVAFGLRDSFELIRSAGKVQVRQVRVSGGGARSLLWRQILADVFDAELVTVNTTEGAAYGAALLAAVGVGCWADVPTACREVIQITGSTRPQAAMVAVYQAQYEKYCQLYPALKNIFQLLAVQPGG